jgi:simple sugar transport system substrate-binding protein
MLIMSVAGWCLRRRRTAWKVPTSPKTLELIEKGNIRFTIDQQPYVQGFYPVVALTLKLRYGISPSDIDAGAGIVDRRNVKQVMQLTTAGYR